MMISNKCSVIPAHYVCNDYNYTSSVTERIDALKWETVEDQRVYYKIFHNLASIPFN